MKFSFFAVHKRKQAFTYPSFIRRKFSAVINCHQYYSYTALTKCTSSNTRIATLRSIPISITVAKPDAKPVANVERQSKCENRFRTF